MSKQSKIHLILGIAFVATLGDWFLPPIPQDPDYHLFADTGKYLGIPNFWNVVSNAPFLLVGALGLLHVGHSQGTLPELKTHYQVFFIGVFLTGLGSAYYHWSPNNLTLVWDRLPMTIAFMALFAMIIGEHIDVDLSRKLLWPFLFVGIASVWYWHWTETQGRGDLRLYALVQFLPMLIIPLTLILLPSRFDTVRHIWWGLAAYGVSKLLEHFDHEIQGLLIVIGGHPLKHLAAALGTYAFYVALRVRRLAQAPNPGMDQSS